MGAASTGSESPSERVRAYADRFLCRVIGQRDSVQPAASGSKCVEDLPNLFYLLLESVLIIFPSIVLFRLNAIVGALSQLSDTFK